MSYPKVTHIDTRRKPNKVLKPEPEVFKSDTSKAAFNKNASLTIDIPTFKGGPAKAYEFEVPIPVNVREEKYLSGFAHRIKGGQLREPEHFQKSFRLGFREAGFLIDEQRSKQGTPRLPMKQQMRVTPTW